MKVGGFVTKNTLFFLARRVKIISESIFIKLYTVVELISNSNKHDLSVYIQKSELFW